MQGWRVAVSTHTRVQECCVHYKESTRMHKNPTAAITTTLPSPRATRTESTKRHVENEAEERGGERGRRRTKKRERENERKERRGTKDNPMLSRV